MSQFVALDLPALATALFACVACGLVGNFLVLRRQSLMGDAISHAVLPGIVAAFLITHSRDTLPVMLGAMAAAILAALAIEAVRRLARIESGAAMGVVFTVFFAAGVVMMEQAAAHAVDLDADCVLYGQLEDVFWLEATGWGALIDPNALAHLPREPVTLAVVLAVISLLLALFHKELKIAAFDPLLADALGFHAGWFHYAIVIATAVVAIASFEAVGSILVIATLICPAATARLLTDRYLPQLLLSGAVGAMAALAGYLLAALLPVWLGLGWALNVAGMIAVMLGAMLAAAALFGPRHGVLAQRRLGAAASAVGD